MQESVCSRCPVHEIVVFQLSWLMLCRNPELPSPRFKKNCICIRQQGGAARPFRDTDVPYIRAHNSRLDPPFFFKKNHTQLEFEYIDADIYGPTVMQGLETRMNMLILFTTTTTSESDSS